ncbi:MAG: I78 family peptidase inhibitor [Paracoccaceae bacterium]
MKVILTILAVVLAGCAQTRPVQRAAVRPAAPVVAAKAAPVVDRMPGLRDKEPDTCKAAGLQGMIGKPAGYMRTVALKGPLRVVGPNEVVDQEEYRSDRVNAYIDGQGIIARIGCG